MSVKIIELNDRAVHVGDETGVILQSPGFALAEGSSIVLGEAAERQARLRSVDLVSPPAATPVSIQSTLVDLLLVLYRAIVVLIAASGEGSTIAISATAEEGSATVTLASDGIEDPAGADGSPPLLTGLVQSIGVGVSWQQDPQGGHALAITIPDRSPHD